MTTYELNSWTLFLLHKTCLSLINTLFSVRIQGLFGSELGLTNIGFGLVLQVDQFSPQG
jgi:hypothetical protein